MRSFSNYRKQCLRESLDCFSARGSSAALFDILRIDLLEAAELPELLTENMMVKSEFNRFRKDYQTHNKYVVESICDYAKNTFYDQLMMEADSVTKTAIDPSAAFRMLRDELKAKLSQMIQELRATISGSMTADRDTEAGAGPSGGGSTGAGPSGGGGSTGAGPSGGGGGPTGTGAGGGSTGAGPSGGGGGGGGGGGPTGTGAGPSAGPSGAGPSGPSGAPMAGGARPTVGSAWNDMKTALRPKDGWLKGLGRVVGRPFRDIGRYIKKNWYDENHSLIESLLMEQNEQIVAMIDKFEKDILAWFDQRSAEIARDAGIDLAAAGIPSPVAPKGANPTTVNPAPADPNGEQGFRPVGTQAQKQDSGTDEKVITGGAGELERAAQQGDQAAQQKIVTHLQNLQKACDILKIKTNRKREWKDGVTPTISIGDMELDLAGTAAKDFKAKYGKKEKEIGGRGNALVKEIAKRIFLAMGNEPTPDLFTNPKAPAKDPVVIHVWDNLPGGGGDLASMGYPAIVAQMLLRFGSIHTGSANHAPTMDNAGGAPTAGPTGAPIAPAAPTAGPTGAPTAPAAGPTGDPTAPTGAASTNVAPEGTRPVNTGASSMGSSGSSNDGNFSKLNGSKVGKIDHFARLTGARIAEKAAAAEAAGKASGAGDLISHFGKDGIETIAREALSSSMDFDPSANFDVIFDKIIKPELVKANSNPKEWASKLAAMKAPPEAAPEAQGEVPPEAQIAPEAQGEVPPEAQGEVPPEAQGEVPPEAPEAQGEVPPEAGEIPTEVPGVGIPPESKPAKASSMAEKMAERKARLAAGAEPDSLSKYAREIQSVVDAHDPMDDKLRQALITQWVKLKTQMLGDEGKAWDEGDVKEREFKSNLQQDPEAAISSLRDELIDMKKQILGGASPEATAPPVGESYKAKIDKYRKLIKESSMNVAPTKRLREKLGLPA
jgi:hypothetical protein